MPPARLVHWKNSCVVVTIEHTTTLKITQRVANVQHPQTITTIITEVVITLIIIGLHIHLSVIKIMSPTIMIISLLLP